MTDLTSGIELFLSSLFNLFKAKLKNTFQAKKNDKKTWSPSAGGSTPCPSEPNLGNVNTGLQGDSLNWVASLTLPICASNVVFIDKLNLHWEMCFKRMTDLASVIEFF